MYRIFIEGMEATILVSAETLKKLTASKKRIKHVLSYQPNS